MSIDSESAARKIENIRTKPASAMTGRELAFIYKNGKMTPDEKKWLRIRINEKKQQQQQASDPMPKKPVAAASDEIAKVNRLIDQNKTVKHRLSVEEGQYDGEDLFSEAVTEAPSAKEISSAGAQIAAKPHKKSTARKFWDGCVKVVHEPSVVIAVVLLLVMVLFIRPFFVPSGSMRPTLVEGDRILSIAQYFPSGSTYQRGDIACFSAPNGTVYVKRVIGIGGDHIQISGEKVYVNGEESPYQGTGGVMTSMDVQLADDEYWVMGDNRGNSEDSRFIGPVKADKMISKVIAVYLPTEHATFL